MSYPYLAMNDGCIEEFKISAATGNLRGAGFSAYSKSPRVVLKLKNGLLQANIRGPANYDSPYTLKLKFARDFHTGGQCVKRSDITQVSLVAVDDDNWYITKITTYIKVGAESFEELTSDPVFNKWLDKSHADRAKLVLSLGKEDTPLCGYGTPVCECKPEADVCVFNLEIDEIRTFTSYQKFSVGEGEGLFVRGTQGVIYSIGDDGKQKPLKQYEGRTCADNLDSMKCSDPQFVDGKTYRMAIGVNGQIPGPTIIVHDKQKVVIHVHNNMTSEGMSIHWHGMHQIGTPWMDGVGQVTQCQIGPSSSFSYVYTASPSGTFWYHSHSGAQRTDGFFGALIVMERPERLREIKAILPSDVRDFEDLPGKHSITLLDWQLEASLDLFSQLGGGLGFYPDVPIGQLPSSQDIRFIPTRSFDDAVVGPMPYFSGLINGKGRHSDIPYAKTRLSVFTVEREKRYRFRLIGAQNRYAYKFSVDGHKLTVVNTDGYWIEPQTQVDYIIVHTGERYDFILEANANSGDYYWMRAETLEIDTTSNGGKPPFDSLGHTAEAILQYTIGGQNAPEISSTQYEGISLYSKPPDCVSQGCKAINCPFEKFHSSYNIECVNVHQLRLLEPTPQNELPDLHPPSDCIDCQHFMNFNFEGDSDTSSINGRNFILPPLPPQTQNEDFQKQATKCSLSAHCNPSTLDCMCTHIVDIPYKKTIQFVLTSLGAFLSAHPIHLHGHTFHVVHIGYPEYDEDTNFINPNRTSPDIQCQDSCQGKPDGSSCDPKRCTKPSWKNNSLPQFTIDDRTIRKDTVIIPAGGYVVINFISDNPGHWFLHCHIEAHQLEGMAMIVNEAFEQQQMLTTPKSVNKCGDVGISVGEYETIASKALSQLADVEEIM